MTKTHHGPVVAQRDGKSLTVRFARFEEGGQIEEWYRMSKSRNLAEFRSAMSPLAVPMFNAMYADDAGNIFYLYNGAVPRRSPKFDWSKPVDGSTPETEWHGFHTIDELPQVLNPKSGFVQNCNSTPFTTTFEGNPDPSEYPKYMVGESDTARARISRRILWNKEKFTFDEWSPGGLRYLRDRSGDPDSQARGPLGGTASNPTVREPPSWPDLWPNCAPGITLAGIPRSL